MSNVKKYFITRPCRFTDLTESFLSIFGYLTVWFLRLRRSAEDAGGVAGGRDGRARLAGAGAVPLAAELGGVRERAGRGHAAAQGPARARQVAAAALARLRRLPQRRGEPARLRREPRRLLAHREALRDELLRLAGDHHQDHRRVTAYSLTNVLFLSLNTADWTRPR